MNHAALIENAGDIAQRGHDLFMMSKLREIPALLRKYWSVCPSQNANTELAMDIKYREEN